MPTLGHANGRRVTVPSGRVAFYTRHGWTELGEPDSSPSSSWRVADIDRWAADHGVALDGAKTKTEKLALIEEVADAGPVPGGAAAVSDS